jgi:hopanoid biosynthesis associated protein HpnK
MKRVIVHADDFGLATAVNQGIVKAFERGILTSTSLMPSGEAFDDAVRLAKEHPDLDIGIHLTLTGERPVTPAREIPSLVTTEGRFREKYPSFVKDYIFKRIKMADVERELTAQCEKVMKTGLPISHIDGHQHLHILPGILEIVVKLAKEKNIPGIRLPIEAVRFKQILSVSQWGRLMLQIGTNVVCRFSVSRVDFTQILSAGSFSGFFYSGRMTKENLIRTIEGLKGGVIEIMCHPGLKDQNLQARYSAWNYNWEGEFEALIDCSVKNLVEKKTIELISYRDLSLQGVTH